MELANEIVFVLFLLVVAIPSLLLTWEDLNRREK